MVLILTLRILHASRFLYLKFYRQYEDNSRRSNRTRTFWGANYCTQYYSSCIILRNIVCGTRLLVFWYTSRVSRTRVIFAGRNRGVPEGWNKIQEKTKFFFFFSFSKTYLYTVRTPKSVVGGRGKKRINL